MFPSQSRYKSARRGGAPQASEDKRRHPKLLADTTIASISKKVNISEVRGQLIRSNSRIFSTTSIYMLSVTDFDPKGTISEVRVHAGAKFGHTGCWSIAKCRPELHRWISKLTARHLQILHQEIF